MFPTIDPAAMTGTVAQAGAVKRPEFDKVAETYRAPGAATPAEQARIPADRREGAVFEETDASSAKPAEKTGTRVGGAAAESDQQQRKTARAGDQAAINFQMSREEREVFLSTMSGRERVSDMSEREKELMERASERLEKLIEAADARDAASRERMDKAVKEWYLRLSNGKQPPADLLTLIRQASQGLLD